MGKVRNLGMEGLSSLDISWLTEKENDTWSIARWGCAKDKVLAAERSLALLSPLLFPESAPLGMNKKAQLSGFIRAMNMHSFCSAASKYEIHFDKETYGWHFPTLNSVNYPTLLNKVELCGLTSEVTKHFAAQMQDLLFGRLKQKHWMHDLACDLTVLNALYMRDRIELRMLRSEAAAHAHDIRRQRQRARAERLRAAARVHIETEEQVAAMKRKVSKAKVGGGGVGVAPVPQYHPPQYHPQYMPAAPAPVAPDIADMRTLHGFIMEQCEAICRQSGAKKITINELTRPDNPECSTAEGFPSLRNAQQAVADIEEGIPEVGIKLIKFDTALKGPMVRFWWPRAAG